MKNKKSSHSYEWLLSILINGSSLEQLSRIFTSIYQCLNLVYYALTVFRISDAEPLAGSIQYFNSGSSVINQFIYHQWDEEFALQVFHILRIAKESLEEFLAVSEVIRSESPEVHTYRSRVGSSRPFAIITDIFHFAVQTLNLRTFYYRCQQSFSICELGFLDARLFF